MKLLAILSCMGSEAYFVIDNFWRTFTLARSIFAETPDNKKPMLHSDSLIAVLPHGLGMTHLEARQTHSLLQSESLLWNGSTTDNETVYEWHFEIANRIHDYRDVGTLQK